MLPHYYLNPVIYPCILQIFHNNILCIFYPFSCCSQNTLKGSIFFLSRRCRSHRRQNKSLVHHQNKSPASNASAKQKTYRPMAIFEKGQISADISALAIYRSTHYLRSVDNMSIHWWFSHLTLSNMRNLYFPDQTSQYQCHGHCWWTPVHCLGADVDHYPLFPGNVCQLWW